MPSQRTDSSTSPRSTNNFSNQQFQIDYNVAFIEGVGGATFAVPSTAAILNAGKSRINGAEIDASINPCIGLHFKSNYTYLNATIRSIGAVATIDLEPVSLAGDSLPPGRHWSFFNPVARRRSRVLTIESKEGKHGSLTFVTLQRVISADGTP